MAPEVDAGRESHARRLERLERKALAVDPEGRAIGVDEEASVRHDGDPEPETAQGGHQKIAPRLELEPALLEDRQRLRRETGEGRALRWRRGRDVEVLGQLLDLAHMALRGHQPSETPAGHVEVLRETAYDESFVGEFQGGARPPRVGKAQIDLVDDERAAARGDDVADALELVPRDGRAGRVRRRGDQCPARAPGPVALEQRRAQLVVRLGSDRDAERLAFERADEVTTAGIARVGEQDLVVTIDDQRRSEEHTSE